MRLVMVVVLLAVASAHADTPSPKPVPVPATPQPVAPQPATPQPATPQPAAPQPAAPQPAAPQGRPKVLPPDLVPGTPKPPDKAPSFGGGSALGVVIVPPPHPDAQPWPKGMVIGPPDVNDPIAIAPGTQGLPPGTPVAPPTWSKQLSDAVQDGLGAIVDLMLPHAL